MKKYLALILVIFLYGGWLLLIYQIYIWYYNNYEDVIIPIYRTFPNDANTQNYFYPFIMTTLNIIPPIIFGFLISYVLLYLAYFYSTLLNSIRRKAEINIFTREQDRFQRKNISFLEIYFPGLITSLLVFNISFQIDFISNYSDVLLYKDNILGGDLAIQLSLYYALLPYLVPAIASFINGIYILGWSGRYYEVIDIYDGETIKSNRLDNLFKDSFKGYIGISTIFSVIQIGYNFYNEITVYYGQLPFIYSLGLPLFIFIVVPIMQLPIYYITILITKTDFWSDFFNNL